MLKSQRHSRILTILQGEGSVQLEALHRVMPEISVITLRRDLAELAEAGALRRTRGGALLPDASLTAAPKPNPGPRDMVSGLEKLDAVVLPPVGGRGSDALRRDIIRRGVPFIAESAPQQGGAYLGPDNLQAGLALGRLAGAALRGQAVAALIIGQPSLPNTGQRADGFEQGLIAAHGGKVDVHRVNGQGNYKFALRVALDALQADDQINLVFGVNDHSAIAAIEAADRLGRAVQVYATGGESPDFIARLLEGGPLRGVCAFFPEVVGRTAVDMAVGSMLGAPLVESITPHELITPENFAEFYVQAGDHWHLSKARAERLSGACTQTPPAILRGGRIGFMPHFPAHDWYRGMAQAMQERCMDYGVSLVVTPPHQGIAAEISRLQREIARAAARLIHPDMVVILGEGQATGYLAEELRRLAFERDPRLVGVTVVTNAFDVLERLEDTPLLKVILTSGEYQRADRCLVGPSLGALFDRLRADCAFLSVAGVTPGFGISALDERRSLVAQRFVQAAHRTVVLADHTALGADAHHRIVGIGQVHEILTDDGALPADRQSLRAAGVEVTIAGEVTPEALDLLTTGRQQLA